jgi:diaminohydroxyphosphoribosylaminopyrimidine deaminase / 5-amino-6-(5-phosphoribosylamino)uracil reductase
VNQKTALARAIKLAKHGPIANPNPRVGAVILNSRGNVIGEGWHLGAGTPHAELAALADATAKGHDVRGATIVVTLEPCNHQGFTGPCALAIVQAGLKKVVYAVADPGATSGGGAQTLRQNGIDVEHLPDERAEKLVHIWKRSVIAGRPYVTLKLATTLDGKVAAADGTSQWITGPESRAHSGKFRSRVGAITVTTGTALADDPALTARRPDGSLYEHQPLALVIGHREIPATAKARQSPGGFRQFFTHDLGEVLEALTARGVRQVLIEGGPALASAALAGGFVDEIHAYIAPKLLGEGKPAVAPFGVATLADAPTFETVTVKQLGNDVFLAAQAVC